MQGITFTIFDTETTGLEAQSGDKLIEIAGIRIQDGNITDQVFESLINPKRPIPFESTQISGITDEMVATAPYAEDVLPKFMEFCEGSILVAHNASFDLSFLEEELFYTNPFATVPTTLCTKRLSKRLFPSEKFHNLDTLTYRLGFEVPKEGRHRALTDVEMLAKVFMKLLEQGSITSLDQLLAYAQEK